MGGRSPRRRAQQPAPVVPLKWTSAGVHAVAARPRAAMRGPARPVIHVEIGHFSTSSQCKTKFLLPRYALISRAHVLMNDASHV